MSVLRAPSEKQTSCHLCTKPGNSRETLLSEAKLLQRLCLSCPVLLFQMQYFLIILALHSLQASKSSGQMLCWIRQARLTSETHSWRWAIQFHTHHTYYLHIEHTEHNENITNDITPATEIYMFCQGKKTVVSS